MFSIAATRAPKVIDGIVRRVKEASEQFSKNRAGLVWVHFAGMPENQFRWMRQHAHERDVSPLKFVSNYILRKESRRHVAGIWYSANPDSFDNTTSTKGDHVIRSSGPVYQAQSFNSRFPLPSGLALPD